MTTLQYFMWEWQHLFSVSWQVAAEGVLNLLDPGLSPRTLLVGFQTAEDPTRHGTCVSPEDIGVSPEPFQRVRARAEKLRLSDPENSVFSSTEQGERAIQGRIFQRAWRTAIREAAGSAYQPTHKTVYCGPGFVVNGYRVFPILWLNSESVARHASLTHHVRARCEVATSLIDAAASLLVEECARALTMESPGSGLNVIDRTYEELVRRAGERLMATPAWALQSIEGGHALFRNCCELCSLPYEGAAPSGRVDLAAQADAELVLTLERPVPLGASRASRKLLAMAGAGLGLLSDCNVIYGLGRIKPEYDTRTENAFQVRIIGHQAWELAHGDVVLMVVRYGKPRLPRLALSEEDFTEQFQRQFPALAPGAAQHMWPFVRRLIGCAHGALLVISSTASAEAARLEGQSTCVKPVVLTEQILDAAVGIDGAVLVSPEGILHAVGVVLDGRATPLGDRGRGSRFNSAVRYATELGSGVLVVVASEDGSIELVPHLRPRVRRRDLQLLIDQLRMAATYEQGVMFKEFNQAMRALQELGFYLSQEQCDIINDLRRTADARLEAAVTGPGIVRILYNDLEPDSACDHTYLLDD